MGNLQCCVSKETDSELEKAMKHQSQSYKNPQMEMKSIVNMIGKDKPTPQSRIDLDRALDMGLESGINSG